MDLYTNNILELASTIPITTRLMNPDITITKRTAICGSSITLDLNISESKISQVGLDIKACALGQASACVFVTHAIGADIGIITELRKNLKTFLDTGTFLIKIRLLDTSTSNLLKKFHTGMIQFFLSLTLQLMRCKKFLA